MNSFFTEKLTEHIYIFHIGLIEGVSEKKIKNRDIRYFCAWWNKLIRNYFCYL